MIVLVVDYACFLDFPTRCFKVTLSELCHYSSAVVITASNFEGKIA